MVRKARAGYVTGGRCFGYDNLAITSPDRRRSHVERRINTSEAEFCAIFQRYAAGQGVKAIAKALNAAAAATPQPVRGLQLAGAKFSPQHPVPPHILGRDSLRHDAEARYVGPAPHTETSGRRGPRGRSAVWRIVSQADGDAAHARFAATAAAVGIAAPGSSCRPRLGVVNRTS